MRGKNGTGMDEAQGGVGDRGREVWTDFVVEGCCCDGVIGGDAQGEIWERGREADYDLELKEREVRWRSHR